jgi:hypothetical protein
VSLYKTQPAVEERGKGALPAQEREQTNLTAHMNYRHPERDAFGLHQPADDISSEKEKTRHGAFTDNMSLPIHRWIRYSAGFSADWVKDVVQKSGIASHGLVLDPFAGSGTTLLACDEMGIPSVGFETHAFVRRVARAKLSWPEAERDLSTYAECVLAAAKDAPAEQPIENGLLEKCYTPIQLAELARLRHAIRTTTSGNHRVDELGWLALTSVLRECSGVGTAQWQYVLPSKSKAKVTEPRHAFQRKIEKMCADMARLKQSRETSLASLLARDARDGEGSLPQKVDLIITSPPYPNNYDYADATRLEMTFWGELQGWGDLQRVVRRHLIRSCSQHSSAEKLRLAELLANESLAPVRMELTEVCNNLATIRETKGGRKAYHTMVAAYFVDLAETWAALHSLGAPGADVYFVIGDSAPYGVHVPVERWLGELALAAGFRQWSFEKIRDRNIKWNNRKHRVPLQEGYLRVRN